MARNGGTHKRDDDQFRGSPPERVLARAQAGREVVQQSVALADSLEWTLGQEYLRQRGNKAFLSDASPVPYIVNNDSTLSRNAASVFFASLLVADKDGTLENDIVVLELGIGVGLFARFFLDLVRELCREHKKDFYDRLTYIAADRSQRMLDDVLRHGVLAEHTGHYCFRRIDAMEPEELLRDVLLRGNDREGKSEIRNSKSETNPNHEIPNSKPRPLRAVFLNYLLDCLPAAALKWEGDRVEQLCVQTCVARKVRLADYTDLTPEQLRQRAKRLTLPHPQPLSPGGARGEKEARDELLEVYGVFASEYEYRPVEPKTLPHGEWAVEFGRKRTKRLLLSVNAGDVKARFNLAFVHTRQKEYGRALARIAEALALDKTGEYEERLLEKQREVLRWQRRRHQQEYLTLINLVSRSPKEQGPKVESGTLSAFYVAGEDRSRGDAN